jgi:hypothetical protein
MLLQLLQHRIRGSRHVQVKSARFFPQGKHQQPDPSNQKSPRPDCCIQPPMKSFNVIRTSRNTVSHSSAPKCLLVESIRVILSNCPIFHHDQSEEFTESFFTLLSDFPEAYRSFKFFKRIHFQSFVALFGRGE